MAHPLDSNKRYFCLLQYDKVSPFSRVIETHLPLETKELQKFVPENQKDRPFALAKL